MTPDFRPGDEVYHIRVPNLKGVVIKTYSDGLRWDLVRVRWEDGDVRNSPLINIMYWDDGDEIPL